MGVPVRMTLAELLPQASVEISALGMDSVRPMNLTLDSRAVTAGDVFVAIPGQAVDGRHYIEAAFARGAVAVLAESEGLVHDDTRVVPIRGLRDQLPNVAARFYGNPSQRMALIAVTGTNGKTSVVEFAAQILRRLGVSAGTVGTLGSRLDGAPVEALNTTPDIIAMNRILAEWLLQGVDHVALEASSHALDQGRLAGLSIHTAVFTNLSRDHLDYHGDEQRYAAAKLRLFQDFDLKRALFNADDATGRQVQRVAQCPAMGISLESPDSDVFVQLLGANPLNVSVHTPVGSASLSADLQGAFNGFNVVAAAMAVVSLGHGFDAVFEAARHVVAAPGRMQRIDNPLGITIVVDYAHTPDALSRALIALRSETSGQLRVVFGCGGDRDKGKRSHMAIAAERHADHVVVTSDNPRSESPEAIIADICAGFAAPVMRVVDRREAIEAALGEAQPGDTVLIAGKGHESYQEVAGQRVVFSDQEIVRAWLQEVVA